MKKIFSLFLLLSLFVGSSNILAESENDNKNNLQDEQAALDVAGSFSVGDFDAEEQGDESDMISAQDFYKSFDQSQTRLAPSKTKQLMEALKKVGISCSIFGFAALASYLTYKLSGKIGLNKELKETWEAIAKTKVLKPLLITGAATGAVTAASILFLIYKYGRDLLEALIVGKMILKTVQNEYEPTDISTYVSQDSQQENFLPEQAN